MIVVADTTPINYLILIDREDLLKELFHRVLIPEAVARELRSVKAPAAVRTWAALPPDWLELRTVSAPANDFLPYLGDGERATIGLGLELGADLVLMDERAGREAARQRNLAVAGTLAILDQAAERQLIDFAMALGRLKETSFFISPAVERFFLDRDVRRKSTTQS